MRTETLYKRNILKTWRRVDHVDVKEGAEWYPNAHTIAQEIGKGDVRKGAGVIAAFSPMLRWDMNVEMARNAVNTGLFIGHFDANNRKAEAIYRGAEPLDVLGGNKVRAFYLSILTAGEHTEPVIDRHAIAVALNRVPSDRERSKYTKGKQYEAIANAYKEVAEGLGVPVSVVQAVTWVRWRKEKGMVD